MRLWSLHPYYLDKQGLVALWREALLAQAVLAGETKGYTNHPQLDRFKQQTEPELAIGAYLTGIQHWAMCVGYEFDASKIKHMRYTYPIAVSDGQLNFEAQLLVDKLKRRGSHDAAFLLENDLKNNCVRPASMFYIEGGPIAPWEKVKE